MNKKFMKLLCLCLAFMLTVSSVAFAQDNAEDVDSEEIIVTEEISEDQEVSLQAQPLEAVFLEYTVGGENIEDDTAVGDIAYTSDIPNALYEVTPSAATYNYSWQADGQVADWGAKRMQMGDEWCIMTTGYCRKDRPSSPRALGNIPFSLGNSFTTDYNQAVFEIDYFDKGNGKYSLIYMNAASGSTSSGVAFDGTNTNTWKTATLLSGTDAHLYRNSKTGLGFGNTSPLRINSNGHMLYVKAFRVYTPGYRELEAAADEVALSLGTEPIEESFALPVTSLADVTWTSSDEDVISLSENTANVIRADYENKECTLTARIEKNGYYIENEYNVTVKAMYQDLNDAKESLVLTDVDTANVTESFALPTLDDRFDIVWSSSDTSLVTIEDNTAVVTVNPFVDSTCTLTAKIYMGERYVEKVFELTMPMQYKKAVYTEYIIGDSLNNDVQKGGMKYDVKAADDVLTRVEPSADTSNLPLVALGITHDWSYMREMIDGRWAAITGKYARPSRTDRPIADGTMPFDTGSVFTEEDKNLIIEVDYYDNIAVAIKLNYKNSADTSVRLDIPRTGDNTWKTHRLEISDAYFVPGKTGMGNGNQSDFRIECNGVETIIGAVRVYMSGYDKVAEAVDSLTFDEPLTGITESFVLPVVDGAEVYWTSSDESIIRIQDGMAIVFGDEEAEKNCTITAKIASNGVYSEKTFDVNLAKAPKKAVITGEPVITKNGDKNTVSFDLTNAGKLSGSNVTLILTAVDKATDEIKDMSVQHELVSGDNVDISASVNVASGQLLKYYLVDENGASLYNLAPSPIENYRGISKIGGAGFAWDHAKDDHFIREYVVYDEAGNEYLRTEENSFVIPDIAEGDTYSFSVEGFDHEGISTGRTQVESAGLFVPSYCDLSDPMTNDNTVTEVYFCTASKDIAGGDSYSEEVEKTDAITGETRIGRKAVNRSHIPGKHSTFLYFRADRDNVDKDVRNVTIIVDYFDEGTADVVLQYNAASGEPGKGVKAFRTTGTNTWKTAVIHLTDAMFVAPSTLTKCDFRFSGGHNSEICISKVTVLPTENY